MGLYKKFGPINIIYSQWLGYLNRKNDEYFGAAEITAYQNDPQVQFTYAHTSGHASLETLIKLVNVLKPSMVVPVHTEHPGDYAQHFSNVTELKDGESFILY
jgi:ribonuclease J